ncbi:MAG: gamma-glutamyltransferase [Bacteroidales bacterium]|nr:gamma-glutamyltransferase [Bacteroidales bacterium]
MRKHICLFASLLLSLLVFSSCSEKTKEPTIDPFYYTIVKKVNGEKAAVVSAHPLASEVGKLILKKGGNAIDASIAMQYALAVVYPNAGNIGGGGFMVYHDKHGYNHTIDFREQAPLAAHKDMFLDKEGNAVSTMSQDGHLSVGIPGTVGGLFLAHKKFGRLPMQDLLAPAIKLAKEGFAITEMEAKGLERVAKDFQKYSTVASAFLKEEKWQAGDVLIQEDLANTLQRISDQGQAGFYEGETADLIVAEMKGGGGIITLEDLKNYEPIEREPVEFSYKGYDIVSMGLPSSGGVLLQQMLGMLEAYPIKEYGFQSVEAVQLMVEISRRAYADRTEHMGDPDFVSVPLNKLLDKDYILQRMSDFTPGKATLSSVVQGGLSLAQEKEETTHLSVVDEEGNAVSVTTTINGLYGSRVVVGGAGFILNNEMDDFSAKPGAPNLFGLLGTESNAIEPGKRMLSTMTPTIVLKNKKPFLVLGTPGGSTILTSVFQTIINIIEFDLSVEDAINKPKFHHQWQPDLIYIEEGFSESVKNNLEEMGYKFKVRSPIGQTEVIMIFDQGIVAVGDKRGDDSAAGY